MNGKPLSRDLILLWYDDDELKESKLDLSRCTTWDSLKSEASHLTSFIGAKLRKIKFQNRDGFDLEENFQESNFFQEVISHYHEILLVDPDDTNSSHGLIASNFHVLAF